MNLSKLLTRIALPMAGLCLVSLRGVASDREHKVKTAFIYSIAKYCDWGTTLRQKRKFIIGIYRTRAYDQEIDLLDGKSIDDRPIQIQVLKSESEIPTCQVAVVGDVGAEGIRHYVSLCRRSGTILVGETEGFAKEGGTIGLLLKDNKVRFEVNLQSAQAAGVSFSSKLLMLAEQVYR